MRQSCEGRLQGAIFAGAGLPTSRYAPTWRRRCAVWKTSFAPYTLPVPAGDRKREVGPRDHRDIAYEMAEDLRDIAGQLQGMKGEAANWLKAEDYRDLRHRLENLHAAAEAAMVEARRR